MFPLLLLRIDQFDTKIEKKCHHQKPNMRSQLNAGAIRFVLPLILKQKVIVLEVRIGDNKCIKVRVAKQFLLIETNVAGHRKIL